ncbi:class F sortase [Microbacterium xanthum]|uniref:class F sortase n=1 Tax=Microbacterium xanthum TaxID=3079794 RepID=UPI002AD4AC10|nr:MULTISPECIES: class F sortase [unclassified Microbacterium]MDZ8172225.1 class F sortase [Microbacterium sp. KSW-48]MDZ8202057.1 class F sortase [Microbacterium sp. SSW1-59]
MSRTVIATGLAPVAIALALTGCGQAAGADSPTATPTPVRTAAAPAPTAAADVPVAAATLSPPRRAVPPTSVSIPAIDVDVPVVDVGVEEGGFMELPVDPAIAGWYRWGSDPSSEGGNTVISAHVDAPGYPIGPFSRLRDLGPGEQIEVADADGTVHRYILQSVTYYPKAELPVNELFSRDGDGTLVLITCGGAFDSATGRYQDNVVAIAAPA